MAFVWLPSLRVADIPLLLRISLIRAKHQLAELVGAALVGKEILTHPPLARASVREMAAGVSEQVLGLQAKVRRTMVHGGIWQCSSSFQRS